MPGQNGTNTATPANALVISSMTKPKSRPRLNPLIRWFLTVIKPIKSAIAILSVILSIAIAGYMVNEKLNTFVTKDEFSGVVSKNDLAPLQQSLNILTIQTENLTKNQHMIETDMKALNSGINAVYSLIIEDRLDRSVKNKKPVGK